MSTLSATEIDAIADRHPEAFKGSAAKTARGWLWAAAAVLYLAFAWWFFAIPAVFQGGNWGIAGTYLADWMSYEETPDVEFEDGRLHVKWPRYAPWSDARQPDWLALDESDGGMASRAMIEMGDAVVSVVPGLVTIDWAGETVELDITADEQVLPRAPLPNWADQRKPGDDVTADFGLTGRLEVESDEVKIRRRFLGWENFVFDPRSPYWGLPAGEVLLLIVSGERIDPDRSNFDLAVDNVVNNSDWQHGDVWIKLLQTIVMAFVGTLFACTLAFPLSFLAARNITRNVVVNQAAKRLFDFLRSVDMLIWALFFTRAFGPGPLAGISAIFFTDTGTFGKLYSEALENIDDKQRDGIRSVGAAPVLVQRYGVLPQVLPVFLSQALYFWESNTRSATIIGAVGAGGIGLKLWEAMRTNSDWENVAYMVILILIVVFVFDSISGALRRRLIGKDAMAAGPH